MSQLMPMPLTVSCFSKIQIGFTFLVPAHLGSPGKRAIKRVCVLKTSSLGLSLLSLLTNTLPGPSASEVTTLWCYTNLFIIIIIMGLWRAVASAGPYANNLHVAPVR